MARCSMKRIVVLTLTVWAGLLISFISKTIKTGEDGHVPKDLHTLSKMEDINYSGNTPRREFLPDHAHMLLILSYQRSGSSIFASIFAVHPDVMFMFEPLDALYVSLYGTEEGWNIASDITSFRNGSYRNPPEFEDREVTDYLHDIFNCRISKLSTEGLSHQFFQSFEPFHMAIQDYISCMGSQTQNVNLGSCRKLIETNCNRRFQSDDLKTNTLCYNGLHGIHDPHQQSLETSSFQAYVKCLNGIRERIYHCQSLFEDVCKKKTFRSIKTIRTTMNSVESLIKRNPNLRIVHLIRDPRAVVLSRKYINSVGIYSIDNITTNHPTLDKVKEAKLYCTSVAHDVLLRRELEQKYPGIFMQVIYEDFVIDPVGVITKVYEFIDEPVTDSLNDFILRSTGVSNNFTNSRVIASMWHNKLNQKEVFDINKNCQEFFKVVAYKWNITGI